MAPRVERDADAEVLFWDVHIEDKVALTSINTEYWHYLRIKIFTERGTDSQGKVALHYGTSATIDGVEGRTIKPDGSITVLRNEDVFERTVARGRQLHWRAKTFAMPAVEPGAIIEYRWHETRRRHLSMGDRLEFQRDIPIRSVIYHLWPLTIHGESYPLRTYVFNAPPQSPRKDADGFLCVSMEGVPAFREEPYMPPEPRVKPWLLADYPVHPSYAPAEFWRERGQEMHAYVLERLKPNGEIRKTAKRLVAGRTSARESLAVLYDFCRNEVKNIEEGDSALSAREVAALEKDRKPGETLSDRMGSPSDINDLLVTLARAIGFEVRLALAGDRSDAFDTRVPVGRMLNYPLVAVLLGDEWKLLDPGTPRMPFGRLGWRQEGTRALLADPVEPRFLDVPGSPAESSRVLRVARFALASDGTLEGEVQVKFAGHLAIREANRFRDQAPAETDPMVRDYVAETIGTATTSDIRIESLAGTGSPGFSFRVRAPGYAQPLGKRILLLPAVFQRQASPMFRTSDRRHPVWFEFAWSEMDSVTIALPDGFSIEGQGDVVQMPLGRSGRYSRRIFTSADGRALSCVRTLHFSDLETPVAEYRELKDEFDHVHEADSRTVVLRQGAAAR